AIYRDMSTTRRRGTRRGDRAMLGLLFARRGAGRGGFGPFDAFGAGGREEWRGWGPFGGWGGGPGRRVDRGDAKVLILSVLRDGRVPTESPGVRRPTRHRDRRDCVGVEFGAAVVIAAPLEARFIDRESRQWRACMDARGDTRRDGDFDVGDAGVNCRVGRPAS